MAIISSVFDFFVQLYISHYVLLILYLQEALHRYTACQLRLAFLLHSWNSTLDYSVNTMKEAEQAEKLFNVGFGHVHSSLW